MDININKLVAERNLCGSSSRVFNAIIAAMTQKSIEECHEIYAKPDDDSDHVIDVVFTINGVEFDFEKIIERQWKYFVESVKTEAAELFEMKMRDITEDLDEALTEFIKTKLQLVKDEDGEYREKNENK